jgi:hypothetical protein
MTDRFGGFSDSITSPGTRAGAIAPADAVDLAETPKAIYVGTGGDIAMIGMSAAPTATGIVWKNVPAGSLIPFRPRRILATGTTAANMIAIY